MRASLGGELRTRAVLTIRVRFILEDAHGVSNKLMTRRLAAGSGSPTIETSSADAVQKDQAKKPRSARKRLMLGS